MRWVFCVGLAACGSSPGLEPRLQVKYDAHCATCHEAGAADAPRRADSADFGARLQRRGLEGLLGTLKQGNAAMPPRGLCFDCSDADLEALARHLISSP